jgi:hypothetical protein
MGRWGSELFQGRYRPRKIEMRSEKVNLLWALRRLRDLELHTVHTPRALQFRIHPNPRWQTSDPCTCIFLGVDVESRVETPKMMFVDVPHSKVDTTLGNKKGSLLNYGR